MKVCVLAIPGLGNTLLAVPMLKELRKEFPKARIDLVIGLKSSAEVMKTCPYIDNVYIINKKIQNGFLRNILAAFKLRKNNYDLSITTIPAAQAHYNILAALIGAKKRIAHDYKSPMISLQGIRVPLDICHDIEQNLNLLKPLGIKTKQKKELEIWLTKEEKEFASKFVKKFKEKKIVGIHPGSSIERGMKEKRWPLENFVLVADKLAEKNRVRVFVFLGPDENDLEKDLEKINGLIKNRDKISIIKDLSIRKTAALISKCKLFVSNDSGLMHLAVACKVPTLGIFTTTDHRRTAPYGKGCRAIYKEKNYISFRQSIEKLAGVTIEYMGNEKDGKDNEISADYVLKYASRMLK